jgi:hypothetical protein
MSGGLSQARLARVGAALRRPLERGELAGLVALVARGNAVILMLQRLTIEPNDTKSAMIF